MFVGPSLPANLRPAVPGVTYLPPAARGDVARAADSHDEILLIDGVFDNDLAPSPKEVYAATKSCRIYGAASMGALRAAECRPFGMIPLGIIARWYVAETVTGDDEVALLYDPVTERALTVPLVNVRYLLRLGVRRGLLAAADARVVFSRSQAVFYADRTWDDVLEAAPAPAREDLQQLSALADLKRHDAVFAIRRLLTAVRSGRDPRAPYRT